MKSPGQDAIAVASRHSSKLFFVYIAVLVVTALVVALFTVLTWRAGNAVQDAIVADANARIEEARSSAAAAIKDAGEANERSKTLEKENLILSGHVAELQSATAAAETKQKQVEVELSRQQEKTAKAERALLELQARLAHRAIGPKVHDVAVKTLLPFAGQKIEIGSAGPIDTEVNDLQDAIVSIFHGAKWAVSLSPRSLQAEPEPFTVVCYIDPRTAAGRTVADVCVAFPGGGVVPIGESQREFLKGAVAVIQVRPKQTP